MKAKYRLAILNAAIVAAIAFLASLPSHIPTSLFDAMQNLYAAGIGASLAFLFQIKPLLEKEAETEADNEARADRQIASIQDKARDDVDTVNRKRRNKPRHPGYIGVLIT